MSEEFIEERDFVPEEDFVVDEELIDRKNRPAFSPLEKEKDTTDTEDLGNFERVTSIDNMKRDAVGEEEQLSDFKYVEPKNPFASGLPSWSLEPPRTPVLRRN